MGKRGDVGTTRHASPFSLNDARRERLAQRQAGFLEACAMAGFAAGFQARSVKKFSCHSNRELTHIYKPTKVAASTFGQRPKTLPVVLSGDEVARIIACVTNIKHRTVLLTLYSAGLRISEGLHLKVLDIDSERMTLKINQAKGQKDRYVPISPRLLTELRLYWRDQRPSDYFFPGKTDDTPLNPAVVQKALSLATAQAGIKKHVTPHTMRHSYATGLLEAGVDLMAISKLLGHSSFTTTMVYLHCRRQHLGSAPSPIDWLPVRQCPRWIDPNFRGESNPGAE